MTNPADPYTLAAQAAADRARAEALFQRDAAPDAPGLGNPIAKLEKVPGVRWGRTHWLGVAAAVVVLPLFGVVAWVKNSEAEYSATGKQGALFGHPSTWLGGHPATANQPALITDDKQYAALIHDYPDLALNSSDPPEIRSIKISAINAHWKAKLQAEQDAATILAKTKITASQEAEAEMRIRNQAKAAIIVDADQTWQEEQAARTIHTAAKSYIAPAGISYKPVNRVFGDRMDSGNAVVPLFEQRGDALAYETLATDLVTPSQLLPEGTKITYYYTQAKNGDKSPAIL